MYLYYFLFVEVRTFLEAVGAPVAAVVDDDDFLGVCSTPKILEGTDAAKSSESMFLPFFTVVGAVFFVVVATDDDDDDDDDDDFLGVASISSTLEGADLEKSSKSTLFPFFTVAEAAFFVVVRTSTDDVNDDGDDDDFDDSFFGVWSI